MVLEERGAEEKDEGIPTAIGVSMEWDGIEEQGDSKRVWCHCDDRSAAEVQPSSTNSWEDYWKRLDAFLFTLSEN
jgi:hypothetical protein